MKRNECDLCGATVEKPGHPVFISLAPTRLAEASGAARVGGEARGEGAARIQIEVILRNIGPKNSGIVHDTCPECLAKIFAAAKLSPPTAPAQQGTPALSP